MIQQLNVEFNVQSKVLPFGRVADMSLAADAIKLLFPGRAQAGGNDQKVVAALGRLIP